MPLLDGCFFLFLYGALALFAEGPENTQSKKSLSLHLLRQVRFQARRRRRRTRRKIRSVDTLLSCSGIRSSLHYFESLLMLCDPRVETHRLPQHSMLNLIAQLQLLQCLWQGRSPFLSSVTFLPQLPVQQKIQQQFVQRKSLQWNVQPCSAHSCLCDLSSAIPNSQIPIVAMSHLREFLFLQFLLPLFQASAPFRSLLQTVLGGLESLETLFKSLDHTAI